MTERGITCVGLDLDDLSRQSSTLDEPYATRSLKRVFDTWALRQHTFLGTSSIGAKLHFERTTGLGLAVANTGF